MAVPKKFRRKKTKKNTEGPVFPFRFFRAVLLLVFVWAFFQVFGASLMASMGDTGRQVQQNWNNFSQGFKANAPDFSAFRVADEPKTTPKKKPSEPQAQKAPAGDSSLSALKKADNHFFLPKNPEGQQVCHHMAYSFSYNEHYEQASWVAYRLTAEQVRDDDADRSGGFRPDPAVHTQTATKDDYYKSGYDRGHLAPAADMNMSEQTMSESFFFSNMSPQDPSFNRGIWRKLESTVRDWALQEKEVYIMTGPVLNRHLQRIGPEKVGVPKHYYKVVYDLKKPEYKAIAFLMKNQKLDSESLKPYVVSIDSLEKFTGLEFMHRLPDELENRLESTKKPQQWTW